MGTLFKQNSYIAFKFNWSELNITLSISLCIFRSLMFKFRSKSLFHCYELRYTFLLYKYFSLDTLAKNSTSFSVTIKCDCFILKLYSHAEGHGLYLLVVNKNYKKIFIIILFIYLYKHTYFYTSSKQKHFHITIFVRVTQEASAHHCYWLHFFFEFQISLVIQ